MNNIKFIVIGILFGIIMYKIEAASWFRIYEMFRFESFHMYGIIGSALAIAVIGKYLIKRYNLKNIYGEEIKFAPKNKSIPRYLIGGTIFGLGWALAGACPGPMYTLIGTATWTIFVVLAAALVGTFIYGYFRGKLPH